MSGTQITTTCDRWFCELEVKCIWRGINYCECGGYDPLFSFNNNMYGLLSKSITIIHYAGFGHIMFGGNSYRDVLEYCIMLIDDIDIGVSYELLYKDFMHRYVSIVKADLMRHLHSESQERFTVCVSDEQFKIEVRVSHRV